MPKYPDESYNYAIIRELLNAAFDDESLKNLCFDHFHEVYENFSTGQTKNARILLLLEYAERHGLIGKLLNEIKNVNPHQYNKFIKINSDQNSGDYNPKETSSEFTICDKTTHSSVQIETIPTENPSNQVNERPTEKSKHKAQKNAAWIYGSVLLCFYLGVFIFFPDNLPPFKHNMLVIISALLSGLISFFLTGELTVNLDMSKWGRIIINAAGGIGVFVLVLWWWTSPMAPVSKVPADIVKIMDQQEKAFSRILVSSDAVEIHRKGNLLTIVLIGDITFGFGSTLLKPEFHKEIEEIADIMIQYPQTRIVVEGHTDNVGAEESNMLLSERRAEAVRDILVQRGMSASRITVVPYGESQPAESNDTNVGRQRNRRVEIKIIPTVS